VQYEYNTQGNESDAPLATANIIVTCESPYAGYWLFLVPPHLALALFFAFRFELNEKVHKELEYRLVATRD